MKKIPIIIAMIPFLLCCNERNNENCEELVKINSGLIKHYNVVENEFSTQRLVTPKRYLSNYLLYKEFKKIQKQLVESIDSLLEEKKIKIEDYQLINFYKFKDMLDSIYLPRIDTVKSGWLDEKTNTWKNETWTQKTILDEFIIPLENRVLNCKSRCDLLFIKLYLTIIDREVISFLYKKVEVISIPVSFIKPITIEKGNKIFCYVAVIDSCSYPKIYIGKSEEFTLQNNFKDYRMIEIIDTIYFTKESAEIKMDYWKKYDAILEYQFPDGSSGRYKLE